MGKKVVSLISTDNIVTCHGLRGLSSLLKKQGHNCRLIFLGTWKRRYDRRILADVKDLVKDSDLIGVSCYSQTSGKASQLIEALKPLKKFIVWGGCHATLAPEECLRDADIVCVGEGEGALVDLVQYLDDRDRVRMIPNLWVKDDAGIHKNPVRPLISCLDDLPREDYDFNSQYFLEQGRFLGPYTGHRLGAQNYRDVISRFGRKGFSVLFSRGCPFSCTYCFMHDYKSLYRGISSNVYRRKSVAAAIAEMSHYKETLCLNGQSHFISFNDNDFFCQPIKDLERFCLAYKERIDIPFGCHVHINSFDEEKLQLLIRAGLKVITAGIQSGSERINREIYNRDVSNARVLEVVRILKKYCASFFIPPSYHFINANPYETEEDVWQTIELLDSFPRPFNVQMFHLIFFPNSYLAKKAMAEGVIADSKELTFDKHYYDAISHTKNRKKFLYGWFVLNLLVGFHNQRRSGAISRKLFRIVSSKRVRMFFEGHPFLVPYLRYFLYFNHNYRHYALSFLQRSYYASVKRGEIGRIK